jgi:hypothetical protein
MNVSDMLDVIHYFYEEDMNYASVEQAQMAEARRTFVFEEMYQTKYDYKTKNNGGNSQGYDDGVTPFNPRNKDVKPYIPPTEVDPDSYNPFGSVLDAPIG